MEPGTDYVALLHRWEDAGGVWRVLGQDRDAVTIGLYRCDDGEEADRFVATDPQLAQFLVGRTAARIRHITSRPTVIATRRGVRARRVRETGSVALCRTAAWVSNPCQRSPCRQWRRSRTPTSC